MNVVCFGAHPDDAEVFAGGTCIKWARQGHRVLLVSLTNGDIGHFAMAGGVLARRRAEEARASAERAGFEHRVLDNHDGELQPTLELRREIVRIIRRHRADLVLTHRPWDYHPDHRYASQAVQDAAFMVTVPYFCPDVPRLEQNPVFAYLMDRFTKPAPFTPDVAVDIGDAVEAKWDLLDAMPSQFYEWLPWLEGKHETVPAEPERRRLWLRESCAPHFEAMTAAARDALTRWYGADRAAQVQYAECFEFCEYGRQPSEEEVRRLFPFFPQGGDRP